MTFHFHRCKKTGVCFVDGGIKISTFMARDAGLCQKNERGGQTYPFPVNLLSLNKHCESSALIAMKVIYLCKLEWLLPLMMDQSLNVKVVHLVRDPRSTINSRIKENPPTTRVE